MEFPRPLRPGDRIGVTSPSSGVPDNLRPRLDVCVASLRERGFEVVVGDCMDGERVTSAPKEQRAAELTAMLLDPAIRAVVPPWGGELAIDLLDQLDWDALAAAEPTWTVGWSDSTSWMLPLSLRLGWASIHGWNLMDTAYAAPDGLLHWVDVASATEPFTQRSPGRHRVGWGDYRATPEISEMQLDAPGSWTVVGGGDLDVSGRLVGGCIECVMPLAGTPYADVPAHGRAHADEGLLVYLEAAEHGSYDVCRALHGLRLSGWFEHANAILIGRTPAPGHDDMSQHDAVIDALGMLDVPIVLDMEIGHTQPFLPLVNHALGRVVVDGDRHEVTQTLA
ncbi:S66 peptidase family protein [Nocardioides sp. LS1]|uniref:S66 family peptidase n=1 Tax=Nocardioides sp. LS1 TaxID=1027620 RepID=UPI000F61F2B8|nr:S66 peptidase family protein [Nocardioides sp. LS1]GCD92000.1 LD-carboxypeptidase [Nocardioides sp. LS1]